MGRLTIVPAIIIAALLVAVLCSGCTGTPPAVNNTTSTPVPTGATLRPNTVSPDTLAASGRVYLDGKPVAGVPVVAVSSDSSDSLLDMTDDNGSFVLHIRPDVLYNATAYYIGLKRSIFPVYLHGTGATGHSWPGQPPGDVADRYDIVLSRGHNATIAGNTGWGYIFVNATPVDGGPSVTAASDYTGQYSLDVQPGVAYRLAGKDYYEQIRFYDVQFYARNGARCETVTAGPDETVLIDMSATRLV